MMRASRRGPFGLIALLAASLACSVSTGGGPDVPATINALSTDVQQTLAAQTAAPPTTPIPAATLTPIAVVTPTSSTITTPPVPLPTGALTRPNANAFTAYRRASPPSIDGNLTDWGSLPYVIGSREYVVYKPENWTDALDQSFTFALAWDDTNLYVAAQVADDAHVQTQQGELIFKGDSLELLLDADLRGDFADQKLSADDFQLGLSPGALNGDAPEAYLWFPTSRKGSPAGIRLAAQPNGQAYQLEAAIPWALFNVSPMVGDRFGFALSSSDDDTLDTAEQQSLMASSSTRKLIDPTTWGLLILAGSSP